MYGTWSRDPGRSLVLPQIVTGRGFDSRQVHWAKARIILLSDLASASEEYGHNCPRRDGPEAGFRNCGSRHSDAEPNSL